MPQLAAAIAGMLLTPPTAPPSQPPPAEIDLSWAAPAECPSAADVEAMYTAMLSAPALGEGTLVANARVLRHGPRQWSLRLTTAFAGVSHTRELRAAACSELAEAAAMVFAVALEPGLAEAVAEPQRPAASPPPPTDEARNPAQEAAPEPLRGPVPTPEREPQPQPEPEREAAAEVSGSRDRPRATWVAIASLGAERGALPGASASPRIGLGLQWRRAQVEADVGWLSPRSVSLPDSASLRAQSVQGSLRGCWALHDRDLRIPLCLGVEAGRMLARSRGLPEDARVRGPWLALGLRTGLAYRWQHWGVFVAAEALRGFVTTRLRVEEVPYFSPDAFSVRGIAGVQFFFRDTVP